MTKAIIKELLPVNVIIEKVLYSAATQQPKTFFKMVRASIMVASPSSFSKKVSFIIDWMLRNFNVSLF